MTTWLDVLETLGAWSLPNLWLPMAAWTLVAAPAYALLEGWRAAHPLVQQWARQALLAALPLGLAVAALTEVSFGAEAGRALPGGASFLLPPVPVSPNDAPAPTEALGLHHALGLLTLGALAVAAWHWGRLAVCAAALMRFRRRLPARSDSTLQRTVREAAQGMGLSRPVRAVFLPQPVAPMTFGVWRPVIVLPETLRGEPERLRMTLAHELVHIRRRDFAAQWIEKGVAALFAAHPLVGRLRRSIAACREEATDAAVLADGSVRPPCYAALLRDVALSGSARRLPTLAITEDAHHLKTRIEAMKHTAHTNRRFPHPARTGALLAALLLALGIGLAACSDTVTPDDPDAAASETPPPQSEANAMAGDVFMVAEQDPKLIGGLEGLQEKIIYPEFAQKAGIDGRVFVQFVIDEEGNVINPTVLRSPHRLLSEEALRVVQGAEFEPGRQDGQPVKVKMAVPITFKLPGKSYGVPGVTSSGKPPASLKERFLSTIGYEAAAEYVESIAVTSEGADVTVHIRLNPDAPPAAKAGIEDAFARSSMDGEIVWNDLP